VSVILTHGREKHVCRESTQEKKEVVKREREIFVVVDVEGGWFIAPAGGEDERRKQGKMGWAISFANEVNTSRRETCLPCPGLQTDHPVSCIHYEAFAKNGQS
jgi:hypothetical protein